MSALASGTNGAPAPELTMSATPASSDAVVGATKVAPGPVPTVRSAAVGSA